MKWYHIILYQLILYPTSLIAGDYTSLVNHLNPNTITIIGETHKHPESITLFQSLITGYLKQNKCLTVGLEIVSSQQVIIDQVMEGRAVVSDIEISPIIDHPPFRKMINALVSIQRKNECLKLIAIDAGDDIELTRDEWMAIKLAEQVGEAPVLVLLGNLHSLKMVNWDLSMTKGSLYVAEILSSQNYDVRTYPQIWVAPQCNNKYQFISADNPKLPDLLNNSFISLLNAFEYKTAAGIVDGAVVWECE